MRHNIYIEPDEEITNIIDKLRKSPEKEIAIVAPKGSILLQSLVNLRILKKESKKAKISLDIITSDSVGKNLAIQAGLPVFKSLKDKKPITPEIEKPQEEEIIKADSTSADTQDLEVSYYNKDSEQGEEEKPQFSSKKITPEDEKSLNDDKDSQSIAQEEVDDTEEEDIVENTGFIAKTASQIHSREKEEAKSIITQISDNDQIESQPEIQTPIKTTPFKKISEQRIRKRAIIIGIFIFGVFAIFGAGITILPRTTISVVVKTEDYAKKIPIVIYADQSSVLDSAEEAYIIGKAVTVEATSEGEATATGKKDVGTKASGDVTVYNGWDTLSHSYNSGTKLTSSGKTFLAKSAFTVPGATLSQGSISPGKVTVSVEALESGESYNIDAGKFVIVGAPDKIYGQITESLSGGTTKQLTIVSEADLEKAKEEYSEKLKTTLLEKIKTENSQSVILEKALQVELSETTASEKVGNEVERFNYKIIGKGKLLVFDYQPAIDKAISLAKKEFSEGKTIKTDESKKIAIEVGGTNFSDSSLPVEIDLQGKIIPSFDQDALLQSLVFKSDSDTDKIIKQKIPSSEEIKIYHSPGFWKKNAILKSNIKIELQN